jgi:hypothetical protein
MQSSAFIEQRADLKATPNVITSRLLLEIGSA